MKNNATTFSIYFIAMPISDFVIVRGSDSQPMAGPSDNPIRDYILRVMKEEDLRAVDVLSNARELKLELKQPTFQNIYSGQTTNPGVFTLMTICRALGRPFAEMLANIQGTAAPSSQAFKESEFALLFETYAQLSPKNQRLADQFIIKIAKRELDDLLKRQGSSNLIQLRK